MKVSPELFFLGTPKSPPPVLKNPNLKWLRVVGKSLSPGPACIGSLVDVHRHRQIVL